MWCVKGDVSGMGGSSVQEYVVYALYAVVNVKKRVSNGLYMRSK